MLDRPLTQEVEKVTIPQFHKDMTSVNELQGVQGGIAGCDTSVFYWLSINEDLHITPQQFLDCVGVLSEVFTACPKPKETFWPGINTPYTNLTIDARKRIISGASYMTNGKADNLRAYHPCATCDDVDSTLLTQLIRHRHASEKLDSNEEVNVEKLVKKYKDNGTISKHMESSSKKFRGKQIPESATEQTLNKVSGLFEAFMHIDVFRGLDANGDYAFIKLNCLIVKPKIPGIDAAAALMQWWNDGKVDDHATKKGHVQTVLQHMCACMDQVSRVGFMRVPYASTSYKKESQPPTQIISDSTRQLAYKYATHCTSTHMIWYADIEDKYCACRHLSAATSGTPTRLSPVN